MSSPDSPDVAAQLIALYNSNFVTLCLEFSMMALLAYNYVITLEEEIRFYWSRKFTVSTALFFVIRYWSIANYVVLNPLGVFLPFSNSYLQYVPWAVFSALRVYALSGMLWPLALFVFILSAVPGALNFTVFRFGLSGANILTIGCQPEAHALPPLVAKICEYYYTRRGGYGILARLANSSAVPIVSRTSLIVADSTVIVVTVVRTLTGGMRVRAGWPGRSVRTVADVLLYDGIMYFAVLLFFSILQVVLNRISVSISINEASYIPAISEPLTAILLSRLLLDLQAASQGYTSSTSQSFGPRPYGEGTLRFAAPSGMMGSLGATTRPDSGFTGIDDPHTFDTEVSDERLSGNLGDRP
ncbi:hypothetical protein C8Q78DRAFT_1078825 [Trametes maxima]|nr:hypothetical protein C8Q78DRAFT_1078825 [Trametes maxima]